MSSYCVCTYYKHGLMFGVFSDSLVALCDTSVTNGKYLKFGIIL